MALGFDVQRRGRWFPQLSVDHFIGSGGAGVVCIPVEPSRGTAVGGLRAEGATRVGLGVGGRLGGPVIQFEGAVLGGFVIGRPGFEPVGENHDRRVLPQVDVRGTVVLFRHVTLSADRSWSRLSMDILRTDGAISTSRTTWSPMTLWHVGVRVLLGAP